MNEWLPGIIILGVLLLPILVEMIFIELKAGNGEVEGP